VDPFLALALNPALEPFFPPRLSFQQLEHVRRLSDLLERRDKSAPGAQESVKEVLVISPPLSHLFRFLVQMWLPIPPCPV